jgi:mycothiol synthase
VTLDGLVVRPYRPADASAVAALVNLVDVCAGGGAVTAPGDIEARVAALMLDPDVDTLLAFAPGGSLVAAGLNLHPPAGGFRLDATGGVHPAWRGRGFGRTLLRWQLDRAARAYRAAAADRPWEVRTGAIVGDEPTVRLFARFGLSPVHQWLRMTARPGSAPPVNLPVGLRVGPYAPQHEEQLHAAHSESFAEHWRYQSRGRDAWATLTVRATHFARELSPMAFDGTELAGYLLAYRLVDPDRVVFGQCGVRKPWRRQRLAAALVSRALATAAEAGARTAALITDAENASGAVSLAARLGFTEECRSTTYAVTLG